MKTDGARARRALAIVLAAGEGTRMRSDRPKVLHEVAGRSMLAHALAAASEAGADALAVVIGPGREDVRGEALRLRPDAAVVVQERRLGTAHAVLSARAAIEQGADDILILFADTPLVSARAIAALRAKLAEGVAVAALGFKTQAPFGYGRLLLGEDGSLLAIREEKDASESEREVGLCNSGLMALDGRAALSLLDAVGDDNAKGEFYLTDVVALARARGLETGVALAAEEETLGVNDRAQLAAAEAVMQERLRRAALEAGVTMVAPDTVFLSADTRFGRDVTIEPHVVIGAQVEIGDRAVVHSFSHLEGARIGEGASVGPFARLRPGARLGPQSKVGNFVELKATTLGKGAKVSHLTYLGDADIGDDANIGAGTITCNYDGFLKYRTSIGAGAFIGSNCALVAPVRVGDGAIVGAGSVITRDVAANALALARGRQAEKPEWASGFRDEKRAQKLRGES